MPELTLDRQLVYVVDRDNRDAWEAMMEICLHGPRPGQVIPVTAEQFAALKSGVLVIQMPDTTKPPKAEA